MNIIDCTTTQTLMHAARLLLSASCLATSPALADGSSGPGNHVLSLDAIGDFMSVPHSASLAASPELTVEYWIHFRNSTGSGRIGKSASSDCQWGFGPSVGTNASNFALCGGATDVNGANGFTVPQHAWVHVAVTWRQSTGTAKVYIDGVLVRSVVGPASAMQETNHPLLVGMQPGYSNSQLFGSVDNLRIWTVERSGQQIEELRLVQLDAEQSAAQGGLVASYTFEDGASDSTGQNPGSLMGNAAIVRDDGPFPRPCVGDIVRDGEIDAVDLAAVIAQWGEPPSAKFSADIDLDGEVGASDLSLVLVHWGACMP